MRAEIVFEILFGVAKRNVMLLEQRVHLEASPELKESTNLSLGQGTGSVGSGSV
jgi:hypothetical protein